MANADHTPTLIKPTAARRGVLLGALMALAGTKAVAAATPDTVDSVDAAAKSLTAALGRLHGGKWHVTVDHTHRFVLIVESVGKGGAK